MDIIPIQASSVPCERVFSSSKETLSARRNALSPNTLEALQLLKFAIKQGRELSFTEGLKPSEEIVELEKREEAQLPEDICFIVDDIQG
jgi:hAT family C-terminal dimerisation region